MSRLDHNIRLARRCIDYVNGLNIKSNNVPFRLGTYCTRSRYHSFVLSVTRCETFGVPAKVLERRRQVLDLLADDSKPKRQRRAEVKALMVRWGEDYFKKHTKDGFFGRICDRKDEARIRNCRRVVKTRHGNCGEKSAVCATWLLENRGGNENILWVQGNPFYDHAWVVFDHDAPYWDGVIAHLSSHAVVVDGWTGDYYQAKHPHKFWHGGLANFFQITVRNNILNASGNISIMEHVKPRDWATSFSPSFRLEYAEQPPSTYEPENAHLLRLFGTDTLKIARDWGRWDETKAIKGVLREVMEDDDLEFEDD
jgi:hypothetical protein